MHNKQLLKLQCMICSLGFLIYSVYCLSSHGHHPQISFVELTFCTVKRHVLWKSLNNLRHRQYLGHLAGWPVWTGYNYGYDYFLHLIGHFVVIVFLVFMDTLHMLRNLLFFHVILITNQWLASIITYILQRKKWKQREIK